MATMASTEPTTTPPIFDAAMRGEIEVVEKELAADPSSAKATNDAGRSALSLAAAKGHAKVVKALLGAGAADTAVAGWTAVHHAAFGGHDDVLSAMLAKLGASALTPAGGMPPLLLAATRGHVACIETLIKAEPAALNDATDAHGRTALMCAASGGSVEAVELLVQRGASIDAVSSCGKTALMWAISGHKPGTTAALARLGANAEITAPLPECVVPGQDRSKGESAEDLANAKHAKDPTLRHIACFMTDWRKAREEGGATPEMPAIPWVQHAIETKAKEEAEAAAAAERAAAGADEPMISEVVESNAAAAADDNDIFGDVDVSEAPAVPVGGHAAAAVEEDAAVKAEAEEMAKEMTADADLDELD